MADTQTKYDYVKAREAGLSDDQIFNYLREQKAKGRNIGLDQTEYKNYNMAQSQISRERLATKEQENKNTINRIGGWLANGGFLPALNDMFMAPIMREMERPFVSLYRGATGTHGPIDTPWGKVKPLTELSSGEALGGAAELGLSVVPLDELARPLLKPIKGGLASLGSKVAGSRVGSEFTRTIKGSRAKLYSMLTNVPEGKFQFAKDAPKLVRGAISQVDELGEEALPKLGEEIVEGARKVRTAAKERFGTEEARILGEFGQDLKAGAKELAQNIAKPLADEGVQISPKGKVLLEGSKLAGDSKAQGTLNKLLKIGSQEAATPQALLNKRSAMKNIIDQIPQDSRNLKRVAGNMIEGFDQHIDTVTGGALKGLRQEYRLTAGNAGDIINSMTDKFGNFSQDKARSFVRQLVSDVKFDKSKSVKILDDALGSNFSKRAQAVGVAKAFEPLAPVTGGRTLDVIRTYGIAKLPILSAFTSPKFMGNRFLNLSAKQQAKTLNTVYEGLMERTFKKAGLALPEKKTRRLLLQNFMRAFIPDPEEE